MQVNTFKLMFQLVVSKYLAFYVTALLEYLDLIVQSADFLAAKASLSPQNASIIPDSYTHL